jgi:hypothetical protein
VVVLDHHKTAAENLADRSALPPNVELDIDMDRLARHPTRVELPSAVHSEKLDGWRRCALGKAGLITLLSRSARPGRYRGTGNGCRRSGATIARDYFQPPADDNLQLMFRQAALS